jgi:hypothetical protein
LFIVALAAFAVLLAASPAPAQSPAILLNIKSPATTSPPSESLLTLDEEGNLWIKGHLYDYAFQSTITLDPNRDYWTIRDTTGKIVWALEVYNPASGASTGDLYSIGSFEGWAADPDQTDAILRYTNASSEVVFSLTAAGEARSRRTGPQRDSAPPYPTVPQPPAIVPDTTPPLLTYPLPEAEYASFENLIIPKPFAQGRFFYNPTDNSVVGEPEDVTDIPWRRRWDPAKASLQAYGARIGSRYQNIWHEIFGSDIWAYNPGFCDEDGMVFRWTTYDDNLWLAYMALNPWGMPTWVEGYSDSYWTVSSISSSPSFTSARPQTPDDFSASMSNDPTPGWNPECGATLDPATSAKSRLFRYWIEFDEKRKASAVPRKDGDRWMNVRCRIVPQNVPLDWVDHLELKVWTRRTPTPSATGSSTAIPAILASRRCGMVNSTWTGTRAPRPTTRKRATSSCRPPSTGTPSVPPSPGRTTGTQTPSTRTATRLWLRMERNPSVRRPPTSPGSTPRPPCLLWGHGSS